MQLDESMCNSSFTLIINTSGGCEIWQGRSRPAPHPRPTRLISFLFFSGANSATKACYLITGVPRDSMAS